MQTTQKIAVVTGAARGIGLAITHKFLADGYGVVLIDREVETLAQTAASLRGQPILAVECDVSVPQQVQDSIARIAAHFGRIDALVNMRAWRFSSLLRKSRPVWQNLSEIQIRGKPNSLP